MAKKTATIYVCSSCGAEFTRWFGKCSECGEWNTLTEQIKVVDKKASSSVAFGTLNVSSQKPLRITEVEKDKDVGRYSTGYAEFDNLLGGGIVRGSINLISGDPGVGKSTILLQTVNNIASKYGKVLYISGEESASQVKMRAERLAAISEDIYLLSETNMTLIENYINEIKPELVIIDSIQCMYNETLDSAPGTVSQIRECTSKFMRIAKGEMQIAFFIVCHVTKEGNIGGPKALEHMVDTVLYFEGDNRNSFRILRGYKNRFGSTNEIAIFNMKGKGLEEVLNPSEIFLTNREEDVSGSSITCIMEGSKPMLLEIQALASQVFAEGATPRRLASGVDYNRMSIILAVLEKQASQRLYNFDIFINTAGGIKVNEPAADLAIAAAVVSSKMGKSIGSKTLFIGEISLTGEVRPVGNIEKRVKEGIKLGYKKIILPYYNLKDLKEMKFDKESISVIGVKNVHVAMGMI